MGDCPHWRSRVWGKACGLFPDDLERQVEALADSEGAPWERVPRCYLRFWFPSVEAMTAFETRLAAMGQVLEWDPSNLRKFRHEQSLYYKDCLLTEVEMSKEDIPTLPAYDDGYNYKVWCEHCRRWHLHGRIDGHRVAHCHRPSSPYDRTGYIIQKAGEENNGGKS
jgi:hypothetical protein